METYHEFLNRINCFEKREITFGNEYFKVSPSVSLKVGNDNKFKKFYGDTVVFDLDNSVKEKLAEYTELLYAKVPECFCERLTPSAFHVTLHDLSNSVSLQDVCKKTAEHELKIKDKRAEIQKHANQKIKIKSNFIFNMVNTSLVLGLYPAGEEDYDLLTELYSIIDVIEKSDYPFTPHITLAYYNINGFCPQSAKKSEEVVNRLNDNSFEFDLNVSNLYYQKFESMNDYKKIINLAL